MLRSGSQLYKYYPKYFHVSVSFQFQRKRTNFTTSIYPSPWILMSLLIPTVMSKEPNSELYLSCHQNDPRFCWETDCKYCEKTWIIYEDETWDNKGAPRSKRKLKENYWMNEYCMLQYRFTNEYEVENLKRMSYLITWKKISNEWWKCVLISWLESKLRE